MANVNSRLEVCQKHEDRVSPWRGECDGVLSSLVVMTLNRLVRGQGSSPHWGTNILTHCYISVTVTFTMERLDNLEMCCLKIGIGIHIM